MYLIKRIGLLFLFSLFGAIIMFLYSLVSLQREFIKWEPLGRPASNVNKVISLDYVQTSAGDIYRFGYNTDCNGYCWIRADAPPLDAEFELPLDTCGTLPPLDEYVDSKAVCNYWGTGFSLTITAVDKNSYVYSWKDTFAGEWEGAALLLSPFIGAAGGFLVGVIPLLVVLYFDLLNWLRKRAQQKGNPENISS